MKNFPYILFDLDGTLIDSGEGIINSAAYALEHMGIPLPEDRRELGRFVGPPLSESYPEFYHLSPSETEQAVKLHNEYYFTTGLWQCTIYPGIPELLTRLQNAGRKLMVATSKPEPYTMPLMKKLGLDRYFIFIAAAEDDSGPRSAKKDVIQYGLDSCGITDISSVVMVGDRKFDINGANCFGMDSIGVTYGGYGSAEELKEAGATWLADSPQAVGDLLLGREEAQ